jgi:hypothetical protein
MEARAFLWNVDTYLNKLDGITSQKILLQILTPLAALSQIISCMSTHSGQVLRPKWGRVMSCLKTGEIYFPSAHLLQEWNVNFVELVNISLQTPRLHISK